MKRIQLKEIASALGLSNATVHRALNNCPGVSYCTRYRVQQFAKAKGYCIQRSAKIAVVMPANPRVFWQRTSIQLTNSVDAENASEWLYMTYSEADSEGLNASEIVQCIESAIGMNISVLIAVVPDVESVRQCLMKHSNQILIVLVGEYVKIPNTFYIGEEPFQSGYELGKHYIENYPDQRSFAMICQNNSPKEKQRSAGFLKALKENGIEQCDIWSDVVVNKTTPYLIARKLGGKKKLPDCVFSAGSNGFQVCSALVKMKRQKVIHCIGFELIRADEKQKHDEILKAISYPDIDEQVTLLVSSILEYCQTGFLPPTKLLYVPNKITVWKDGVQK